jgi:hypothetical protein
MPAWGFPLPRIAILPMSRELLADGQRRSGYGPAGQMAQMPSCATARSLLVWSCSNAAEMMLITQQARMYTEMA